MQQERDAKEAAQIEVADCKKIIKEKEDENGA